jgi:hypothetical protein
VSVMPYTLLLDVPPRAVSELKFAHLPKKIFQTWRSTQVSEAMHQAVYSFIEQNPDWHYQLFTDAMQREFIQKHFSPDVLKAYDTIVPGAFKADLWRYCVLYIEGGVYLDIKFASLQSLNMLIPLDAEFVSFKDHGPSAIYQAFLCAKPQHPFFKQVIDDIVKHAKIGYYGVCNLSPTGPVALGQAASQVLGQSKDAPLTVGEHEQNGVRYTLWQGESFAQKFKSGFAGYNNEKRQNIKSRDSICSEHNFAWVFGRVYTHGKVVRNVPVPKKRLKTAYAGLVCTLYKNGYRKAARQELWRAITEGFFSFKLLEVLLLYGIVKR